ncbi:hypothetical protein R9X47_01810 [Wukongibacter baidiensis]|uniref:hypothetical protein n=1 Tax=Wukongibacter baidiensis TaxID=1723361 RepID=UPI003D7F544E
MSMYRKNALNQLKLTFEEFLEEYKDELSSQEAFNLAKEYEIETWKEQLESYKDNAEKTGFNVKDAIKICKTMINELSKVKTSDLLNK